MEPPKTSYEGTPSLQVRRLIRKNTVAVKRYTPPRRENHRPGESPKPSESPPPLAETGEVGETPEGGNSHAEALRHAYEQGVEEGYRKGHQEGYRQGYEAGAQQTETQLTTALEQHFNSLLEALKTGAAAVADEGQKLREQFEARFPQAVLMVAEAVLRHEAQTNEAALKALVQETMNQFDRTTKVTVHLNPADYERLAEQPPEVWNSDHLTFVPDESVSAGGALFTTETSVIDARLETRLIEAARALLFPETT